MDKARPLGRLTLAKKEGIYIDYYMPLATHQLDGIRFLYRNYKKVKPGVILNDPSGYGKCVQVVSFLNAVHTLLTRPVLILCEPNAVENWRDHFNEFTEIKSCDIAPETANPFENYLVFIRPLQEAAAFSRRHWSVVVVHDDIFTKDRFQTNFNAQFKIWVTSVNMKENLSTFALIYEWIHPNSRVNIADFEPKTNNPHEVIEKLILVDAYLDDIVIRGSGLLKLFDSKRKMSTQHDDVSSAKVSRKNKDPTGKKVKRSKKNIEDDITLSTNNNHSNGDTMNVSSIEVNFNNNNNKEKAAYVFDSNKEFNFIENYDISKKVCVESFNVQENVKKPNKDKETLNCDDNTRLSVNLFSNTEPMNFENCLNENKRNDSQFDVTCETHIQNSTENEDYIIINEETDLSKKSYLNFLKTLAERNNKETQAQKEPGLGEIKTCIPSNNYIDSKDTSENNLIEEISPVNVTIKNKDPTGKKIKRSKKITEDEILNINKPYEDVDMTDSRDKDTIIKGKNHVVDVVDEKILDSNNESCVMETNHSNEITGVSHENEDAQLGKVKGFTKTDTSQKSVDLFSASESTLNFQKYIDDIVENENKMRPELNGEKSHLDETAKTGNQHSDTAIDTIENLANNKNVSKESVCVNDAKINSDINIHKVISESSVNEEKQSEQNNLDETLDKSSKAVAEKDDAKNNLVTKAVKTSTNNIEDILAKFEQEALKKYKGSFLDRLF